MIKEILLFGFYFIVIAAGDCPFVKNSDIHPCICLTNQLQCTGQSVTDDHLKLMFHKLSTSQPEYMKYFDDFLLMHTKVTHINPQVFGSIVFRRSVKINSNPITEASFGNFPDLVFLDISHNQIKNISSNTFLGLKSLRYVSVAGNHIEHFPKDTFAILDNIERIDLTGNKIKKLVYDTFSSEFHNNIELSEISLADNELTVLPDFIFWPLRRPRLIDLVNNKLTNITANTFSFNEDVWKGEVIMIYLTNNGLMNSHFHADTFKHIERLKLSVYIDLTYNNLTHIDKNVFEPLFKGHTSTVVNLNNNPIKCGDCGNKWIFSEESANLRSKRPIEVKQCSDDHQRSLWQFNANDFKNCK